MELPVGSHVDRDGVRGYPIDMRVKAQSVPWPPASLAAPDAPFVAVAQYGLGCYERWLAGEGEAWLEAARAVGNHLVQAQEQDGAWLNRFSFPHTFLLKAPWPCAMAQGEGASLLVRLYLETGESRYAEAACQAMEPFRHDSGSGGTRAFLEGDPWPEEYPTSPPSFVLNGAIFSWWGIRDVAVGLDDSRAAAEWSEGVNTLARHLEKFDTGWWSLYCLFPQPARPVASSFYHALHMAQLEAMNLLAPREAFQTTLRCWMTYSQSRACRSRALAGKVLYRIVIPRNRLLASRLPWITPSA
jgi:hypothetical protein